ncbi:HNH endonuclease [Achromobacter sp. GG226]|uniref:HNH endonuclease n=1 Tax=Verticiella alkaliphila TaxID=2779529 RepID=UPI001C0DC4FC|nr:HNH endonuclease [Verticiella sp. GG226]MBU4609135.1 HNH endonuclease [Verticiella sp. GG226]
MAARIVNLPTPEQLRQLLRYEPETGKLFWRPRCLSMFPNARMAKTWNTRFAGNEALVSVGPVGYRYGAILGQKLYAHRVIWAMQSGCWPVADIDHANTIRTDNRFENLREASRAQNLMNTGKARGKTGIKGVTQRADGVFVVEIRANRERHYIGRFRSLSDAAAAYADAATRLHGEFARTRQ